MAYYTYFKKQTGMKAISFISTNMAGIALFDAGININALKYHFGTKNKDYYEESDLNVTVIRSRRIERGRQRIQIPYKGHNRNI
jgi:hypothetical protein